MDEHNNVWEPHRGGQMRAQRLPHRSTYILVFNAQGALYVQKRTMTKDVFPGYYDPAAGGVVLAGESYEESAQRELYEEMGIRDVPLTPLFTFYFADERTRVWGRVFTCVYEGALVLQPEEVESGNLPVAEILRRPQTAPYTPDGMYVLRRHLHLTD